MFQLCLSRIGVLLVATIILDHLNDSIIFYLHCRCQDLSYELRYDHVFDDMGSQSFFKPISGGKILNDGDTIFVPFQQRQPKLFILQVSRPLGKVNNVLEDIRLCSFKTALISQQSLRTSLKQAIQHVSSHLIMLYFLVSFLIMYLMA